MLVLGVVELLSVTALLMFVNIMFIYVMLARAARDLQTRLLRAPRNGPSRASAPASGRPLPHKKHKTTQTCKITTNKFQRPPSLCAKTKTSSTRCCAPLTGGLREGGVRVDAGGGEVAVRSRGIIIIIIITFTTITITIAITITITICTCISISSIIIHVISSISISTIIDVHCLRAEYLILIVITIVPLLVVLVIMILVIIILLLMILLILAEVRCLRAE